MKRAIRNLLSKFGYRIEGIKHTPRHLFDQEAIRHLAFDDVVCRHVFEHGADCTFLQIGAYDGISTDPLRKFIERLGWKGVMLEPQPGPARQLRTLYPDGSGIMILEAAVDRERRTRSLFTIESDAVPDWVGSMASFDRAQILKHERLVPGIAAMIREIQVPCVTMNDALDYLVSDRLDILQIDAEGADGFLLSLFPFERMRPAIIHWEIKHISKAEQEGTLELLRRHGYRIARSGSEDMMAVLGSS